MNDNRIMLDRCRSLARAAMEDMEARCERDPERSGPLTQLELAKLSHCSPRLLAAIGRVAAKLATRPQAGGRIALAGGSQRPSQVRVPAAAVREKLAAKPPAVRRLDAGGSLAARRCGMEERKKQKAIEW